MWGVNGHLFIEFQIIIFSHVLFFLLFFFFSFIFVLGFVLSPIIFSNTPLLPFFLVKIWPSLLNVYSVKSPPPPALPLLYFLLCMGGVLKPDYFLSHPAHGNPSAQQSFWCVLSLYVRLRSIRDTSPSIQFKYNLTCDGSPPFTNFEFERLKQVQVKGSSTRLSWSWPSEDFNLEQTLRLECVLNAPL